MTITSLDEACKDQFYYSNEGECSTRGGGRCPVDQKSNVSEHSGRRGHRERARFKPAFIYRNDSPEVMEQVADHDGGDGSETQDPFEVIISFR